MNSLSLQAIGIAGVGDSLGQRLGQLDPKLREEVVRRAVYWGVQEGLADWKARNPGGMAALSQEALTAAVEKVIAPYLPAIGQQLVKVVEPAAQKAADVVGPAVESKIRQYGPTLAIITGVVAAVLSILGMVALGGYIVKKVG